MSYPNWFTCKTCHPHGIADHSHYGDKACLIADCLCEGYSESTKRQRKNTKKSDDPYTGPLPQVVS